MIEYTAKSKEVLNVQDISALFFVFERLSAIDFFLLNR